jgi:hypothetical protein
MGAVMLGTYQQSNIRIEVPASEVMLRTSLLQADQLQQWLWFQRVASPLPAQLQPGLKFTSWVGPIPIQHFVQTLESNRLLLLLSQGIDGFHEWAWGDGWVQSRIEGITTLPLNLGQTISLLQLRHFLRSNQDVGVA